MFGIQVTVLVVASSAASRYCHCSSSGVDRRAVLQRQRRRRPVRSWLACGRPRPGRASRSGSAERLVLDHVQHDHRGADLEEGGDLAEVGVAVDHVQPAVPLRVGVRLVTGVDDGSLQGRLQPDLDLEEVGSLGHLEGDVLEPELVADAARPDIHRPGHEERGELADESPNGTDPRHEVVLVGAVGRALAVGVVLVDQDATAVGQRARGACGGVLEDPLPRLVPDHQVAGVGALRRRVLRMGVVDVEPGAVGQDGVGQPEFVVGRRFVRVDLVPAGVAQRVLVGVVPLDVAGRRGRRRRPSTTPAPG